MLRIVHFWLYGLPSMAEIVVDSVSKSCPDGTAAVKDLSIDPRTGRNLSRAAATE
jgi:hypothetical protein